MDDRALAAAMIAYIEQNLTEPITSDDLAERAGYSPNRFREKFYNVTGETPSGYLRKRRLTEAAKELLAGQRPIDVAATYGYSSQDNFTTAFRSYFGVTPTELGKVDVKYRRFVRKLREAFSIMEIANLKQPPLHTTLMGCIKGASDFFDNDLSTPMLFGLSGHAFMININVEMCPSAPYVWNHDRFFGLLDQIGIKREGEVARNKDTSPEEVKKLESQIRSALDDGKLCILDYLEHQLVSGYDENGLTFLLPWDNTDAPIIKSLPFGTWEPCMENEGWVCMSIISRSPRTRTLTAAARDALEFALSVFRDPQQLTIGPADGSGPYRVGYKAYEAWLAAVDKGMGTAHGHWWSAMVWAECRHFAGAFFTELSELLDSEEARQKCEDLNATYMQIGDALQAVSNREMPAGEQHAKLETALDGEHRAEEQIEELVSMI